MSSIRFRLGLLSLITLLSVGGFGFLTAKGWQNYSEMHEALSLSYELQDKLSSLNVWQFSEDEYKYLQEKRATLSPQHRMEALSDVIQSYADKSQRLVRSRTEHFVKNEVEFRKYTRNMMNYWQNRVTYFGVITLSVIFLSVLILFVYLQKSTLKPINDLSKKMTDFLNNKYTYQFSVPAPNEVGHLQATFNSLAQRVLSNIEELKALDNAKTEFLSIASHELRTPLTSIKGSLSLLKSGVAGEMNEPSKHLMNIAEVETDRLIRLINDLLDLAKIEAGRLPMEKAYFPLEDLIKDTFGGLEGLAHTAEVQLVAVDLPMVEIEMDKDKIQQVLTNLISNAIKYSPKNGKVTVSCELLQGGVTRLIIADQGRGIDPEDQARIFEKFSQATNAKNPLVKGTGLGLAIARAIVDEHGGEIGVTSKVGEGSQFYFSLPNWKMAVPKADRLHDNTQGVAA